MCVCVCVCVGVLVTQSVRLFATPWTVAHQAPPSVGFSKQEYGSGLPFPPPGSREWGLVEKRSVIVCMSVCMSVCVFL